MRGTLKRGARGTKIHALRADMAAVARLHDAVEKVERDHPLPRCAHGKPLMDGGGDLLEPDCGCRYLKRDAVPRRRPHV